MAAGARNLDVLVEHLGVPQRLVLDVCIDLLAAGAENERTRALVERVTARGRVMITGATVGDRFVARICVLSFRTRREHVAYAVEDVLAAL